MVNTRSKSGISKPVALAPASEPPKPKAKKPTPAKPKTVRFSDGHQSRDSHRQQGALNRRRRSPSPRRDYVQAPPYGMPNVGHGHGYGLVFFRRRMAIHLMAIQQWVCHRCFPLQLLISSNFDMARLNVVAMNRRIRKMNQSMLCQRNATLQN